MAAIRVALIALLGAAQAHRFHLFHYPHRSLDAVFSSKHTDTIAPVVSNSSAESRLHTAAVFRAAAESMAADPRFYYAASTAKRDESCGSISPVRAVQPTVGDISLVLHAMEAEARDNPTASATSVLSALRDELGYDASILVSPYVDGKDATLSSYIWALYLLLEDMRRCGARVNSDTQNLVYSGACRHRGRVFGVGVFKTGTTSLVNALDILGYKKRRVTEGFFPHYTGSQAMFDEQMTQRKLEDWSGAGSHLESIAHVLDKSQCAADGPWLFLFERMDKWYPNSKFVLTLRSSTTAVVNSDLKMATRGSNFTFYQILDMQRHRKYKLMYGHSIADFALLIARRYEIHVAKVRKHFEQRPQDLLEIVFRDESSHPWHKISEFLGCPEPDQAFPHSKRAPSKQRNYLTKDVVESGGLNWQNFDFVAIPHNKFVIAPKAGLDAKVMIGDWQYVCTYCEGFFLSKP